MESTSPKSCVFVLMPFSEDFRDIYELGIKQACVDAGAYCERVDEQIFHENILERVYNQIAKADVIIAEMTGRNPNVFYEVGYAHALNKKVILLTQDADDIPFDLKQYPHIVYGGKITVLKTQLEPRVKWFASQNQSTRFPTEFELELFVANIRIINHPTIMCDHSYITDEGEGSSWFARTTLHTHNISDNKVGSDSLKLAVICPEFISILGRDMIRNRVNLPDKTTLFELYFSRLLFPNEWAVLQLKFQIPIEADAPLTLPMVLRLFKETGSLDYPFNLVMKDPTQLSGVLLSEIVNEDTPF